ncbi:MAG TPA: hypothetical protein VGW35_01945 [Methylomirabilota bacterium]|jgi:hypothetical protein|nr:hypothetical protein [Methylomirabilota bacterium]
MAAHAEHSKLLQSRREPLVCYFDTSAFDHLQKTQGISQPEARAVLSAVEKRRLVVVTSLVTIEEAIGTFAVAPARAPYQLHLIHDLTERFVKPPMVLVSEAILSFAAGAPVPSPFIEDDLAIREQLRAWAATTQDADLKELLALAYATRLDKKSFRAAMGTARLKVRPAVGALKASGSSITFHRYRRLLAPGYAAGLVQAVGAVLPNGSRDLDKLLRIRTRRWPDCCGKRNGAFFRLLGVG